MSKLDRFTLFIDDDEANLIQLRNGSRKKLPEKVSENRGKRSRAGQIEQPPAKRFPVKRSEAKTLVPVVFGSPWKHYTKRYAVRHWCLFVVGTGNNCDKQSFMIRGLSSSMNEEQIQRIRNLCDDNIVQSVEIYSDPDDGYFLVSQMMETSLLHVRRAPVYPSEPQLSSILFQVLSGCQYLKDNGLVHEQISCAGVLINLAGEVKISDIELCQQEGDMGRFFESFCRFVMMLMDKDKSADASIGLSRLDQWSDEAVDMFTLTSSQPSLKHLAAHSFWQKRRRVELKWLVHLTLITAWHGRK